MRRNDHILRFIIETHFGQLAEPDPEAGSWVFSWLFGLSVAFCVLLILRMLMIEREQGKIRAELKRMREGKDE